MAPIATHVQRPSGTDAAAPTRVTRPRSRPRRREPAPLDQLPAWTDLVPVMDAPTDTADGGIAALLRGLNPDQLRAVTHRDGPLLVVAGAGTGKTQVITRRIAWLIATRRARPSEILALTFTDKAADEMATRVDQLVPYGYTDTAISTFHAFGDRIIREHALEIGLPTDVRVLSRAEVVIFLREHLYAFDLDRYRPLGDPTRFLSALASLFSRCKDEDISPDDFAEHAAARTLQADRLRAEGTPDSDDGPEAVDAVLDDARGQRELAGAYATYQQLLAANGCIDFGDQVALALRLVRTSPAARAEIAGRFRYILVDEFQDTNRAQAELVGILAERHRNVTVVGDDDQAIYAFRGAAIDNILDFRARHPDTRTVVLRRNYRSLAPILDASYRLIRRNDPERLEARTGLTKRLRPERSSPTPAPVRLEAFATGAEEADWIASDIARRVAGGARPRDHAVLVRANGHADPILRALNMAAIPWRFSGASGLYGRPDVRLLMSFLRAVADPDSSADVYALCSADPVRMDGEDLVAIVNAARRRNRSVWAVMQEVLEQPGLLRLRPDTRTAIASFVADLRRSIELAQERPAGEVLYAYLRDSGMLARLARSETAGAEEGLANVARFFDIIRAQSTLLADDRAVFVARHLQTLMDAGDDPPTADLDPDADAVAVLTVHKAKGLEFPVVYLPGLVAGRFPGTGRSEPLALPEGLGRGEAMTSERAMAEERRLFYVALTRARDEAILCHAADYGGARARRVSPFVLEALDLPSVATIPGSGARVAGPEERIAAFATPAVPVVAPRGPIAEPLALSFYQVDDYLTCPRKYQYAHVLRIPLAPHHAIVYGAALHKAVQLFHQRHARGQVMTEAELDEVFLGAWSSEGFVSREHEDARLAAGRAALRRFRQAQLAPEAVIPTYVEREFAFMLGGDRVRGRWDRVDVEPVGDGPGPGGGKGVADRPGVGSASADVVSPTLGILGHERVTITDYKSSDVRDPARARQRARDSLQLQIYAMGYEAMTGRLPDALSMHFLDSGVVGTVPVDPKRLARARERIGTAAAGIRARDYTPTPDRQACTWCAYRGICPASAAGPGPGGR
ncbi:MAG: ATP-dependent helicase [Candidatus Limnocylindria bacterium]